MKKQNTFSKNHKSLFIFVTISFILLVILISIFAILQIVSKPQGNSEKPVLSTSSLGELDPDTGLPKQISNIQNKTQALADKESRDYLAKEWKAMIMKNHVVAGIDALFTKMNGVFIFLFHMPYSISFLLLGVIFFWICASIWAGNLIKLAGIRNIIKSENTADALAYLAGTFVSIELSWLDAFQNILIFIYRFTFARETWLQRAIVGSIFVIVVVILFALNSMLSRYIEQARQAGLKDAADQAKKEEIAFNEGRKEGLNLTKK